MRMLDLTGQRFGRLVVVELAARRPVRWNCTCDCGNTSVVAANCLRSGNTKSCGCGQAKAGEENGWFRHGYCRTPTYQSWCNAYQRCTNTNNQKWEQYGGRGIKICERWRSFESFLADMGEKPRGATLDRIDVDGHYEPGNCRWATQYTQQNNRSNNRRVAYQGKLYSLTELAAAFGLPYFAVRSRIQRGWTVAETIETPMREASVGNVNSRKA